MIFSIDDMEEPIVTVVRVTAIYIPSRGIRHALFVNIRKTINNIIRMHYSTHTGEGRVYDGVHPTVP